MAYRVSRRPVGAVIPAVYDGFCRSCRTTYAAGTMIRKAGPKQWVHENCPAVVNGHTEPPASVAAIPESRPAAFEEMDLVRGIVRDELAGATLQVDADEVKAIVEPQVETARSLAEAATRAVNGVEAVIAARVTDIVTRTRDELVAAGVVKTVVEIRMPDGRAHAVEGVQHPEFPWLVELAAARENILMIGPAGCGKTTLAKQIAIAIGLGDKFSHISCSAGMSEGQLTGRLLPIGEGGRFEYVRSEFVKRYEEGGVFLIDEIDAADSNTMVVLHSALSNGEMAVPNRPDNPVAKRHPDFVCVAAANTHGTGADRMYVGRNQLDEATLDRFRMGQIELDYDPATEKHVCPDDDLRNRLQGYRANIRANRGMRRTVSMRFLEKAYKMKLRGATDQRIDRALFSGWSPDEIKKVAPNFSAN